jgi:hypothetical protein
MYCPNCGVRLFQNAKYCHSCGAAVPQATLPVADSSAVAKSMISRIAKPVLPKGPAAFPRNDDLEARRPSRPRSIMAAMFGTVILLIAIIGSSIRDLPASSQEALREGVGNAVLVILLSPLQAAVAMWPLLLFCNVLGKSNVRFTSAYRATLWVHIWVGLIGILSWFVMALTNSDNPGMAIGILAIAIGAAWLFGSFLKGQDDTPLGMRFGAKLVGLYAAFIFVIFAALAAFVVLSKR